MSTNSKNLYSPKQSKKSPSNPKKKFEKVDHFLAAKNTIETIGKENLFFSTGTFWLWKNDGVWHQTDDREIKRVIHQITCNEQITGPIVSSITDLIKTEVTKNDVDFDINSNDINCLNGELSYSDSGWVLKPHNREHFRTSIIPVSYNPLAEAPRFKQFISEVFSGDQDKAAKEMVIEEAIGYTLIPSCNHEKFMMLIGTGANGKSVLLRVLLDLIGRANVSAVQPEQFENRFQRAHLHKKLANIVTEIKEGGEIADAQLKSLTSGELTTAEKKFFPPFDFTPYATHWFGTNHLPHTRDFSDALFRRGIILTFNNKFEGLKRDVKLGDKLKDELSGILNIGLNGLSRLIENGCFTNCPSSAEALNQWRVEADQAAQFVDDCCESYPNKYTPSGELFKEYSTWADSNGIKRKLNQKNLTQRLEKLGYKRSRGAGGIRLITGIAIKKTDNFMTYDAASNGY